MFYDLNYQSQSLHCTSSIFEIAVVAIRLLRQAEPNFRRVLIQFPHPAFPAARLALTT